MGRGLHQNAHSGRFSLPASPTNPPIFLRHFHSSAAAIASGPAVRFRRTMSEATYANGSEIFRLFGTRARPDRSARERSCGWGLRPQSPKLSARISRGASRCRLSWFRLCGYDRIKVPRFDGARVLQALRLVRQLPCLLWKLDLRRNALCRPWLRFGRESLSASLVDTIDRTASCESDAGK